MELGQAKTATQRTFYLKNDHEWAGRRYDDDWYVSDLYAMIIAFQSE